MKKFPILFLISITIFAVFMVFSITTPTPSARLSEAAVAPSIGQNKVIATACIITINNQKYDVTQFQYQHSGGNIFQCGTDMTSIFVNRHSQRELNIMQLFLVK
jgi:cytochrome b involved in lipid metabolism